MIAQLTTNQIEEVLENQIIGHLACHADGKTYVVPISFAYDGQCIYAHTYEGLKMKMMRKNPEVCFQVDERKNMANWKSVVAWGIFEEITDPAERNKGLEILISRKLPIISSITTHLGANWPFQTEDISKIDGIVFRIVLKEKTGRFEESAYTPAYAL